ncbi:hypothetical protein L2E82_31948 [Cichorium intybus]|uniref:Uncharacterized protein n=1 Tax=Cichorium intybus TaxID=13427 RepID=A0ACB9BF15_CICIN|nr:hypothetical protein L2E82_31948 [Cichorium intybus]
MAASPEDKTQKKSAYDKRDVNHQNRAESPLLTSVDGTKNAHFVGDVEDIPLITGINDFFVQFGVESKKLWYLAAPAIFTTVYQYSVGAITQTFAGHVGTLDLAAVSVENSVIAGFSFGVMVGMGIALETCHMKLSIVSDFRLRWQRFFAVQRQSHETITKEQQMVIQFLGDRCK